MLNLNKLKSYYYNSPKFIKEIYSKIPFNLRNGKEYRKWRNFLRKNINVEEYEFSKLKETIEFAYKNIEFYNKFYKKNGIHPNDIKSIEDFKKLPFIDKKIVQDNYSDFYNHNLSSNKYFYVTTGGSSGAPSKFLQSNNVWKKELAFVYNLYEYFDYLPNIKKASFRGGEFTNLKKDIYWKSNPLYNETHFSPFHISNKSIKLYVDKINQIKAQMIHAYPSALLNLMQFMKDNNLSLNYSPRIIILISEDIIPKQIEDFSNFFKCRVTSFYGHSERLIFAPNYSNKLEKYKIDRRYGFFEVIDAQNNLIKVNNVEGEIIGTSFDNYMMPLIRYKTNDFCHYLDANQSEISLIKGRWECQYLIGLGNTKISLAALNLHSDVFKNTVSYQFYQAEIGKAFIYCVIKNNFNKIDKENIEKALNNKTKNILDFKVKIVDKLQYSPRGKFKQLISEL